MKCAACGVLVILRAHAILLQGFGRETLSVDGPGLSVKFTCAASFLSRVWEQRASIEEQRSFSRVERELSEVAAKLFTINVFTLMHIFLLQRIQLAESKCRAAVDAIKGDDKVCRMN